MTVIFVSQEDHGCIGVATNYEAAVKMLFEKRWIDADLTRVWDENSGTTPRLSEVFGEDCLDKMCGWGIEKFNDYWKDFFFMSEYEVYGG